MVLHLIRRISGSVLFPLYPAGNPFSPMTALIKGWNGVFHMQGSPSLIRLALLTGIGARNSIGCGFLLQKSLISPMTKSFS